MRAVSPSFQEKLSRGHFEPRYVVQLSWDAADTDHTYLTSTADAKHPGSADVIDSVVDRITGQTQTINPLTAVSTIGSIKIKLIDHAEAITDKINTKLTGGAGLRGKLCRVYVGDQEMEFDEYDLRATYEIDSISYLDGAYTFVINDPNRTVKNDIFSPHETSLRIPINASTKIIPVNTSDLTLFPVFEHDSKYTVMPSQEVSYIKMEDEVIAHTGLYDDPTYGTSFAVIQRGALNTRAVSHGSQDDAERGRQLVIREHVYIEGPAPKVIYALLTGELHGQSSKTLPDHWHLSIDTSFVRLTDFTGLDLDLWDSTNNTTERPVRIENPGSVRAKSFIEKQLLLWMGCFMPVYSTGELGIKRLSRVLPTTSYDAHLDESNVIRYSALTYDYKSVLNDFRIDWNYVDALGTFTKRNIYFDADSIAKWRGASQRVFEFRSVHTGINTDENILAYFDVMRHRYSNPPLKIDIEVHPSFNNLEVGDTVRLTLDQVRDVYTGNSVNRTFEVQQVTTDWTTGRTRLKLFGSAEKASELTRTELTTVLQDSFYTSEGTNLTSVLTISGGAVTANGTITGTTDLNASGSIFYYDGDLTINAGVTVTIENNVQLRIKGTLQINGTIDGTGNGGAGEAACSTFSGGGSVQTYTSNNPPNGFDRSRNTPGYFGTPVASGAFAMTEDAIYSFGALVGYMFGLGVFGSTGGQQRERKARGGTNELPIFNISNPDGESLTGLPGDLRGKGGVAGIPSTSTNTGFISPYSAKTWTIRAASGAGGDGGAGLCTIARGVAYGGAGVVKLNGNDAGTPSSINVGGVVVYGGEGAAGAPGAWLMLFDGDATNPLLTSTKFEAKYGDTAGLSGTSISSAAVFNNQNGTHLNFSSPFVLYPLWTATPIHASGGALALHANENVYDAASSVQYLPVAQNPADDPGNFPSPTPNQYYEFRRLFEPSAAANDKFGFAVTSTDDGTRLAVHDQKSTGEVHVFTNVNDGTHEQTIVTSRAGQNCILMMSEKGDRMLVNDQGQGTSNDQILIYSRTGTTWALEQTLTANTTGGFWGAYLHVDKGFNYIVAIPSSTITGKVEFWTRSGSTWSYQTDLDSLFPAHAASGNNGRGPFEGNADCSLIALNASSNNYYPDASGTNVSLTGGALIFTRDGATWSYEQLLNANHFAVNLFSVREGGLPGTFVDGAGTTVITFSFQLLPGYDKNDYPTNFTTPYTEYAQVANVYYREGDTTVKYVQAIHEPDDGTTVDWIDKAAMSRDGRTFVIYSFNNEKLYIYKREVVSGPFLHTQSIEVDELQLPFSIQSTFMNLSDNGEFIYLGDYLDDQAASNAGVLYVWQLGVGTR